MLRFPGGIDGERFFQKQAPDYFPSFIARVELPKAKGTTNYAVVNNRNALAYTANHRCTSISCTLADVVVTRSGPPTKPKPRMMGWFAASIR